jgi:hypothetical protein
MRRADAVPAQTTPAASRVLEPMPATDGELPRHGPLDRYPQSSQPIAAEPALEHLADPTFQPTAYNAAITAALADIDPHQQAGSG